MRREGSPARLHRVGSRVLPSWPLRRRMGSSLRAGRSGRARGGSLAPSPPAPAAYGETVGLPGSPSLQPRPVALPRVICDIRVLGLAPGAYVCHTFLPALLSERCLMGFSLGCNPSLALHLADFFNFLFLYIFIWLYWASQVALVAKNPPAKA